MHKNLVYRPDIDGLRAVAVLSVILFHLGLSSFSGGFVGVDVFFVISGYLITRLILAEIESTGKFSYKRFYLRRARRLFPALFTTLLICAIVATCLLSPTHLKRFGGALLHALFSLSNVYFWMEADYFDAAAKIKPLLHTWSLSIEEQFYLIWPFTIALLYRRYHRWKSLVYLLILASISLWLNVLFASGSDGVFNQFLSSTSGLKKVANWFSDGRATIFYLLPFRVFEFIIGASVIWVTPGRMCSQNSVRETSVAMGMALIFYSVLTFNDSLLFPSFSALLPCIGTALVIYGGEAKYLGRVLNNPLSVGIGLISYSLYLVHWPLIVFWHYYRFQELLPNEKAIIFFMTFILAWLMYKFVEQRFRKRRTHTPAQTPVLAFGDKRFVTAVLGLALILTIPASLMWKTNGWVWRLPSETAKQFQLAQQAQLHTSQYGGRVDKKRIFKKDRHPNFTPGILTLGDSHAQQYLYGLLKAYPQHQIAHIDNRCRFSTPDNCYAGKWQQTKEFDYKKEQLNYLRDADLSNTIVVISQVWTNRNGSPREHYDEVENNNVKFKTTEEYLDFLEQGIQSIHHLLKPKQLIIIGQVPSASSGEAPLDCLTRPIGKNAHCASRSVEEAKDIIAFNQRLRLRLATMNNVKFIAPSDHLCDSKQCHSIIDNTLIYSDGHHLSKWGSEYIIRSEVSAIDAA